MSFCERNFKIEMILGLFLKDIIFELLYLKTHTFKWLKFNLDVLKSLFTTLDIYWVMIQDI